METVRVPKEPTNKWLKQIAVLSKVWPADDVDNVPPAILHAILKYHEAMVAAATPSAAESGGLTERLKWLSAALSVRDLHKEIATVEEAIIALAAKDAWMPIETAPKDGTPVILFSPYKQDVNCAGGLIWISGGYGKAAINPDSWRGESNKEPPTKWQPLPAAPDSGQEAEG